MFISIITVLFVVSPFSLVASSTCTTSNALSWADSGDSTGDTTGGSSGPCSKYADNPKALQVCLELQSQGECNAVGGSACPDSTDDTTDGDYEDLIRRAGDTLSCTSDETCYEYVDGSLFCFNEDTGDYVDDVGGFGNVYTGEYTGPDGTETTDADASATTSSSNTRSSSSSAAVSDTTTTSRAATATSSTSSSSTRPVGATGIATGTAASASSASTAAPTANLGAGKVRAGSAMGVLGLIVALA